MSQPLLIDAIAALALPVPAEVAPDTNGEFVELLETLDPGLAEDAPAEAPALLEEQEAASGAPEAPPSLLVPARARSERAAAPVRPLVPRELSVPESEPPRPTPELASNPAPVERAAPSPRAPEAPARTETPTEPTPAERAPAPETRTPPPLPPAPEVHTPVPEITRTARPAPELRAADVRDRIVPELPVRNEAEILEQARVLVERGGGRARIELRPPSLGELGIRVVVQDRAVAIELIAERAGVAELFSQHLPALRHALEAVGLDVDRLDVGTRTSGGDAQLEAHERSGPRERQERPPSPDGRNDEREPRPDEWTPLRHGGISLGTVDLRV